MLFSNKVQIVRCTVRAWLKVTVSPKTVLWVRKEIFGFATNIIFIYIYFFFLFYFILSGCLVLFLLFSHSNRYLWPMLDIYRFVFYPKLYYRKPRLGLSFGDHGHTKNSFPSPESPSKFSRGPASSYGVLSAETPGWRPWQFILGGPEGTVCPAPIPPETAASDGPWPVTAEQEN